MGRRRRHRALWGARPTGRSHKWYRGLEANIATSRTSCHPLLGYLAGWASLLVGFAGPIAIDAFAAGAFLQRIYPGVNPNIVGVVVIALLTAFHGFSFKLSKNTQNGLVIVKIALVVAFVVMGLAIGSTGLPAWTPTTPQTGGFPMGAFVTSLFFIAFAFSGWECLGLRRGGVLPSPRKTCRGACSSAVQVWRCSTS